MARMLPASRLTGAQALSFVPVNDGTFQFPPSDFYMQAGESCGLEVRMVVFLRWRRSAWPGLAQMPGATWQKPTRPACVIVCATTAF